MNILGLFSPTGTLPILHREVGGQVVTHSTQSVTTTTETSATQKTQGGSFEERVVYARNPQVALTVSVVHRAIELRSKTMGVMPEIGRASCRERV